MTEHFTFRYDFNGNTAEEVEMFLRSTRNHMDDTRRVRGEFYLNEALDVLHIPRIREGQFLGWTKSHVGFVWSKVEGEDAFNITFSPNDGIIFEELPAYKDEEDEDAYLPVRVYADWQIAAEEDLDVISYLESLFLHAQNEGKEVSFTYVHASSGAGLYYIFFTVDTKLAKDQSIDPDEAKMAMEEFLNKIVHDNDVDVRWIEVLSA